MFEPSAERGVTLDRCMRERLADTLDYVLGRVGEDLGITQEEAAAAARQIRAGGQAPNRFGLYYDMVVALEREDVDQARRLARELIADAPAPHLRILAIDDRRASEGSRFRRLLVPTPEMAAQPSPQLLRDTLERIDAAFDLLDRGFPGMSAEIRSLLRELVIAAGPEDPDARTFDGSSSYMLWGATLLNARGQTTVLDTAQALAHESGHNLLFGFCHSGSLVENPDEELFSSPLREDPRPMDGVFHATYVVARMHQTVSRLLEAGVIPGTDMDRALADLATHRRNFDAGDQVVREGARLTPLGAEVIESARAYMATAD